MKLQLKYCCFCAGLRTGSLIFAYLTLVRDLIVTLTSIIILSLKQAYTSDGLESVVIPVFGILLAVGMVNVIMAVVLIVGIHKYKNAFLKTYLIFNLIQMVVAVILILTLCITSGLPGLIALCLVFLAFHVYYLLVIRSYSLELKDPSNKPAIFDTFSNPPASEFVVHFKPGDTGVTNYTMS